MPRYFVMDFPDWVQVVALDEEENFIMVQQYRYPGEGYFLEFPGGSTHPSRQENALDAAKRELREETGYESEDWDYVGSHYPNPALMGNKCIVYLARNCKKKNDPHLDPYEVLDVELQSKEEMCKNMIEGDKLHSLMLATYQLLLSSKKIS